MYKEISKTMELDSKVAPSDLVVMICSSNKQPLRSHAKENNI